MIYFVHASNLLSNENVFEKVTSFRMCMCNCLARMPTNKPTKRKRKKPALKQSTIFDIIIFKLDDNLLNQFRMFQKTTITFVIEWIPKLIKTKPNEKENTMTDEKVN